MIEVLQFIFSSIWHFLGVLFLVSVLAEGLSKIGQSNYYNYIYKKEDENGRDSKED